MLQFNRFTLGNGLKVIVHEDASTPMAVVNVMYDVGARDEDPSRTGFAHLFEHLMFNGSENYNKDYFKLMESIGATDLNGTTNEDRTNYFQNIPVSALDQVLWLESDRMGHLLGVIDTARLNEQRGVVQNEKRQGERLLPLLASECLAIEDSPPGIQSAHAVGMHTLGVTNTVSEDALRAAGAEVVTNSLADWTVDSVKLVFV